MRVFLFVIFGLLLIGWAAGFLLGFGGSLIHLLLVAAVSVLIASVVTHHPAWKQK